MCWKKPKVHGEHNTRVYGTFREKVLVPISQNGKPISMEHWIDCSRVSYLSSNTKTNQRALSGCYSEYLRNNLLYPWQEEGKSKHWRTHPLLFPKQRPVFKGKILHQNLIIKLLVERRELLLTSVPSSLPVFPKLRKQIEDLKQVLC